MKIDPNGVLIDAVKHKDVERIYETRVHTRSRHFDVPLPQKYAFIDIEVMSGGPIISYTSDSSGDMVGYNVDHNNRDHTSHIHYNWDADGPPYEAVTEGRNIAEIFMVREQNGAWDGYVRHESAAWGFYGTMYLWRGGTHLTIQVSGSFNAMVAIVANGVLE